MPRYELVRASPANGLFKRLKHQWAEQLAHEDAPTTLFMPMLEHAEGICDESPQDSRYGIFVVVLYDDAGNEEAYEGLVHINHKLPKTSVAELRLVWNLVAPRYAYEEVDVNHIGTILGTFFIGALKLCDREMPARQLRMYLGNAMDRGFAQEIVVAMKERIPDLQIAIRGGWLHISFASR